MNQFSLCSLLPRGTKTWRGEDYESAIALIFASKELATALIKYAIHTTDHGSDHETIETIFDAGFSSPQRPERLLFKNAPWKEINARIREDLEKRPAGGTV